MVNFDDDIVFVDVVSCDIMLCVGTCGVHFHLGRCGCYVADDISSISFQEFTARVQSSKTI